MRSMTRQPPPRLLRNQDMGTPYPGIGVPALAFLSWWIVCFCLYFFRWPINYAQVNLAKVSALFLACLLLAAIGYWIGTKQPAGKPTLVHDRPTPRVPFLGLVCTVVLFVPIIHTYSGFGVLEVGAALQDQSTAYTYTTERIGQGFQARSFIVIAQTLLAPLTLTGLPYFALAWFDERRHGRILALLIVFPIMTSILVGRDQQIGIVVLTLLGTWLLSRVRRGLRFEPRHFVIFGSLAATLALATGLRKLARTSGAVACPPGSMGCGGGSADPDVWHATGLIFASYASQGFEGLGRAFMGTWNFGGGASHSRALDLFLQPLLGRSNGLTVSDQLVYFGWSSTGYWSTAFTNIANDVPWVLVPFVIALLAYLLAITFKSAVLHGDWLSTSVFVYTWIAMVFVPQNFQLGTSGPLYVGYLCLTALYLLRRGHWRRAILNES